jgi:hypothetical protein
MIELPNLGESDNSPNDVIYMASDNRHENAMLAAQSALAVLWERERENGTDSNMDKATSAVLGLRTAQWSNVLGLVNIHHILRYSRPGRFEGVADELAVPQLELEQGIEAAALVARERATKIGHIGLKEVRGQAWAEYFRGLSAWGLIQLGQQAHLGTLSPESEQPAIGAAKDLRFLADRSDWSAHLALGHKAEILKGRRQHGLNWSLRSSLHRRPSTPAAKLLVGSLAFIPTRR